MSDSLTVEIPLRRGGIAIIDAVNYERVSAYIWHIVPRNKNRIFYACTEINGKIVYLHRFVMNALPGKLVDHIDGNGLNCVVSNMRYVTRSQNRMNAHIVKSSTSRFKGVRKRKDMARWQARIRFNGREISIGRFDSEKEAAIAYNEFATKLFGEFASLNNIDEPDSAINFSRKISSAIAPPVRVIIDQQIRKTIMGLYWSSQSGYTRLARQFGISQGAIRNITTGINKVSLGMGKL